MYWMDYRIEAGEMAPDFRLESTAGKSMRLYDCKNKKTVLLFFFNYHDDRCMDRLQALARDYRDFKDTGAVIFPISILKPDEGRALAQKLGLPFAILCDDDHAVSRAYHASKCQDPAHVCFNVIEDVEFPEILIIDTSGIIRYRHVLDGKGAPDNAALIEECRNALE
jgi:thioredoxin-dependent peroxiredoxin